MSGTKYNKNRCLFSSPADSFSAINGQARISQACFVRGLGLPLQVEEASNLAGDKQRASL